MKIVFLGTPDFAVPSLRALAQSAHEIVGVITQPDRPRDRGRQSAPPVKTEAQALGLPVYQFEKIRAQGVDTLRALAPDLMVTCAYGQIISQEILDVPPKGVINVHASLLPKYRGASPIQWAVIDGEKETGITIMRTSLGVDCGDVLLQRRVAIMHGETAGELFERLSVIGAQTLIEAIGLIERGEDQYEPQDDASATHCRMLTKEDGKLNFTRDAQSLAHLIDGLNPWPSAYCYLQKKLFKIWKAEAVGDLAPDLTPATLFVKDGALYVKCKDGALRLIEVQAEGKKRMTAESFVRGANLGVTEILE